MQDYVSEFEALQADSVLLAPRRLARALTNYANTLLKPLDLNIAQVSLLAAVAIKPEKTLAAMSEALSLDSSTLTRNLVILEGRGLIRSEGGRGRGGKQVEITDKGVAALRETIGVWRGLETSLREGMSPEMLSVGQSFIGALTQRAEALNGADAICAEEVDVAG